MWPAISNPVDHPNHVYAERTTHLQLHRRPARPARPARPGPARPTWPVRRTRSAAGLHKIAIVLLTRARRSFA